MSMNKRPYSLNVDAARQGDFANNYMGPGRAKPRAARIARFKRLTKYVRRARGF